ncbi:MAG: beta-ketoacyl synthase N-terminal-like domain-containing protein, partial [Acidobacteriota bacterium]
MLEHLEGSEIAIIGMAGRFPGAKNLGEFWQNLHNGIESIRFFTDAELKELGVNAATLRDPNYVKAAALLDDIELFDASFFGMTNREAEITDPQHRLLLECAWQAIEHAGYNPEIYPGAMGIYAGATISTYLLFNLFSHPEEIES